MKYTNILLIDDDEDDGEIFLAAVKELESVKCKHIHDATEALHDLATKNISPDVIFLDLNMPVMNGQQFLVEIKKNKELENIPVIIFSTTSHRATIQLTKELGAYDFITKPDSYNGLVNVLKPILS